MWARRADHKKHGQISPALVPEPVEGRQAQGAQQEPRKNMAFALFRGPSTPQTTAFKIKIKKQSSYTGGRSFSPEKHYNVQRHVGAMAGGR